MKMAVGAISMRELQKISAGAIQALPHPVPIKNGTATVGVLVPAHSVSRDYLRKVFALLEEAEAKRTPEEQRAIDEVLAARGIE
ncbi:hypothetical protein SAZ10_27760 [Mesorhizobium sp. BAC0120]|uniref:hypothetical protein n=1 Tax=Mesorhizobium sp. BAC0120 TaxID=3090670 RepID=UPI00298C6375|nr:hypothetical protein [Mesorhizobium sp. BAC0120]MDW6025565.1 hypothetical protein [Mesorhizobium sp. BAC0120]